MNYRNILCALCLGLLLIAMPQIASAAGTASGTLIDNSAVITYTVGVVGQNPVYSDTASFLVDNKVDLTVATVDGSAVIVVPGQPAAYLTYSVTNNGNSTQDYSLIPVLATGTFFGATDNFDATGVVAYHDVNDNGTYEPATDNVVFVDELMADSTATVFIVGSIPIAQVDFDGALYDLIAQTAVGGAAGFGGDITNDDNGNVSPGGTANDIADDATTIQIVFADLSGSADAVADGRFSSRDAFLVGSAVLAVTKLSSVTSDPFNGISNPKAIPGATITYTLDVANSGSTDATLVALVDQIPTNTTFVSGSIGGSNSNGAATVAIEYSTDGIAWSAVETAPVTYIRVTFSVVDANDGFNDGTAQLTFDVTIN